MERGFKRSMAWPQCLDHFCRTQGHPCPITGLPKEKLFSAKDPVLGVAVEEVSFLRKGVFKGFWDHSAFLQSADCPGRAAQ